MQITLNQNDIEQAIRQYVTKMGITRPIDEINFTQTRTGGVKIGAEIELIDPDTVNTSEAKPAANESTPRSVKAVEKVEEPKQEASEEVTEEPAPQEDEAPVTESKSLFGQK
jgi:hypothetical protein